MHKKDKLDLLIFYGMPHSGKSSLARRLVECHGFFHVNMGERLRNSAQDEEFPFRNEVVNCQKNGEIVSDLVALYVLDQAFSLAVGKPIVLDGFPRLPNSIPAFKDFLQAYGRDTKNALIVNIRISSEDSFRHAKIRGRADDTIDNTIKKRIQNYHEIDSKTIEMLSKEIHVIDLEFQNGMDNNFQLISKFLVL